MEQLQFPLSTISCSLVLLLMMISNGCVARPVDIPVLPGTEESTKEAAERLLLVENTISNVGADIPTARPPTSVTVISTQCEYAGPPPVSDYTAFLAIDWVCKPVRDNTITIPQYVYKMQPINQTLWDLFRDRCGCAQILNNIPYVRFEASSATWILDTQEIPVGTSCDNLENDACKAVEQLW